MLTSLSKSVTQSGFIIHKQHFHVLRTIGDVWFTSLLSTQCEVTEGVLPEKFEKKCNNLMESNHFRRILSSAHDFPWLEWESLSHFIKIRETLTWANSFSISPARITNGPRTAYSIVMKWGLIFSSWRHLVDIFVLCWLDDMAESPELQTAAVMKCLFFCGDDKTRPTVPGDVKRVTKRLIAGRKENNELKAFCNGISSGLGICLRSLRFVDVILIHIKGRFVCQSAYRGIFTRMVVLRFWMRSSWNHYQSGLEVREDRRNGNELKCMKEFEFLMKLNILRTFLCPWTINSSSKDTKCFNPACS